MAFSRIKDAMTLKANADFSSRQYHIVELTSNPLECKLAAAGEGIGILQNHPQSGEACTVATEGESRARAGAAIIVGAYVTAANTGFAVAVTSGAVPGKAIGRALTAAASGSVFSVLLEQTFTVSGAAN